MEIEPIKTSTEAFEEALSQKDNTYYCLRLYIAGTSVQSMQALENVKKVCEDYLQGGYKLEVIDISQQPKRIEQEDIIAVPTLIKTLPLPLQKVIGDMSKVEKIIVGLDILPQENNS